MKNEYEILGDTTAILVKSVDGMVTTIIDTTDLPKLLTKNWSWRAYYMKSKEMYVLANGTSIHRFIMDSVKGDLVDHIDRNPLNNTRANLRTVSPMESVRNRSLFKNNTSGYAGVSLVKSSGKWKAKIRLQGKEIFLGNYSTIEEAIQARMEGEKKYWT
jgi:hypothetical protein